MLKPKPKLPKDWGEIQVKRNNGSHRYLSHLKFATGHDHNLKPKEEKQQNMVAGCPGIFRNANSWLVFTSVLYSQSILKKSPTVWGSGP